MSRASVLCGNHELVKPNKFLQAACLSFVFALGSFASNFIPGSYSLLPILIFCLSCLLIFLGFAIFGRKGFWLLLGTPFALAFLAVWVFGAMGSFNKI